MPFQPNRIAVIGATGPTGIHLVRELVNYRAAVSAFVAVHNLCNLHRTIRMTPDMKAGLTGRVWSVGNLLAA